MIAAWQVRPPRLVTMAEARFITGSQSGSVMSAISTSPGCTRFMSSSVLTTRATPEPILAPTARPSASTLPPFSVSAKRSIWVAWLRDFTVSGRACTMNSLPLTPSLAHSMSIGRP
ncbi:hypothetical protein G6F59_017441 [Rhizopus arrhizus]|nr:hypothetical protein G6F59_017441 [Rhizopus arrhizus]